MKRIILLASFALLTLMRPAVAQQTVTIVTKVCNSNSGVQVCNYAPVDASNPLASTTPWTPNGQTTASVTTASSATQLPGTGTALVCNTSANTLYFALGDSSVVATTNSNYLPPNSCYAVAAQSNGYIALIAAASTASVPITTGTGTPLIAFYPGSGGGSSTTNLTGINGVTPLVGAGATGTGSLRDTVAQDTTTIAGSAPGVAGTPSTNVVSVQGVTSGKPIPAVPTTASGTAMSQNYTTPGTANVGSIGVSGVFLSTPPALTNSQSVGLQLDALGNLLIGGRAITPVVSTAAENNHVIKGSGGTLLSVYATNQTATAGFLVVLNATTAPADGAITPLDCAPLPANGYANLNYNPGPGVTYSTGITAVLTSAATCFTKTTGVITGFIKGAVQ